MLVSFHAVLIYYVFFFSRVTFFQVQESIWCEIHLDHTKVKQQSLCQPNLLSGLKHKLLQIKMSSKTKAFLKHTTFWNTFSSKRQVLPQQRMIYLPARKDSTHPNLQRGRKLPCFWSKSSHVIWQTYSYLPSQSKSSPGRWFGKPRGRYKATFQIKIQILPGELANLEEGRSLPAQGEETAMVLQSDPVAGTQQQIPVQL